MHGLVKVHVIVNSFNEDVVFLGHIHKSCLCTASLKEMNFKTKLLNKNQQVSQQYFVKPKHFLFISRSWNLQCFDMNQNGYNEYEYHSDFKTFPNLDRLW